MPFVMNQWYAAIWAADLADRPVARRMLGKPLVLFRTAEGVAALDDLCPHRFVPLSLGSLSGDGRIRCAYHGLEFDAKGACVHNPHTSGRIPPAAKVRSYPAIERYSVVWVWHGDKPADPDLIPDYSHLDRADPKLTNARQWLEIKANYQIVVNNLLDLSHACVLHDGVLGNSAMTDAEIEIEDAPGGFIVKRLMRDAPAPRMLDLMHRGDGGQIDHWADIRLIGPSCLINDVGVTDVGLGRGTGTGLIGAHMLTPIDETTTLYHFCSIRVRPPKRSAEEDQEIARQMGQLSRQAFSEQDAVVMEAQQAMMADPDIDTSRPALFDVDIGAARYERHLKALLAAN